MPNGPDQVVTSEGPLFCLSWCKRKRWLLVGGNARLHIYNVSFCLFYWLIITAAEALLQACTGSLCIVMSSSCSMSVRTALSLQRSATYIAT